MAETEFKCECGETHVYPAYVYAHWNEEMLFTCPKCKVQYSIIQGIASKITAKKRKSSRAASPQG